MPQNNVSSRTKLTKKKKQIEKLNVLFESSDLEQMYNIKSEAIIEEYKSIRAEIVQRIGNQQTVTNFALTLIAAVIGVSQLLPSIMNKINMGPIYLLASLIFSAFALMLIEQDIMNSYLGSYIDMYLRTNIENILNVSMSIRQSVWQWEDWRKENQYNQFPASLFFSLIAASRYAITIIPAAITLYLFVIQRNQKVITLNQNLIFENVFFIFCFIALLLVIAVGVFSGTRYIKRERK
jgi:hypothetical protein